MSGHAAADGASDREIVASRRTSAGRGAVYAAFRDPVRLARWWGPRGFTNTFDVFEFRPGGAWRFTMHGPDGNDYRNESVFVETVEAERIVVRHLSPPRFELSVTLDDDAGGTRIEWRMRFETPAMRDRAARYAVEANEQNLDRLEAEVASGA